MNKQDQEHIESDYAQDLQSPGDQKSRDSDYRQFLASQSQPEKDNCPLCQEASLHLLINDALFYKYPDERQGFYYVKEVDEILQHRPSMAALQFKENQILDEDEEFMRREYKAEEFEYKHKAISEYYKFHQDYPLLHEKGVQRILQRFYDRKKQCHYKEIKRKLKEEEGISISTHKSSSMFSDEDQESLDADGKRKVKDYSDVLGELNEMQNYSQFKNNSNLIASNVQVDEANESRVLQGICDKIGKAYEHQAISPLVTKKKTSASIFDKPAYTPYVNGHRQKEAETKKFVKYLQSLELKDEQSKTKQATDGTNGTRSNKQSRYNSIEHDVEAYNKKYISSNVAKNSFKTLQNTGRKSGIPKAEGNRKIGTNAKINHKNTPFFYDSGKNMYADNQGQYNGLGSLDLLSRGGKKEASDSKRLIYSKKSSKGETGGDPSVRQIQLHLKNMEKNAFVRKHMNPSKRNQHEFDEEQSGHSRFDSKKANEETLTLNGINMRKSHSNNKLTNIPPRSRTKQKTTEQIYSKATDQMKSRKKSTNSSSYASLAINQLTNLNSIKYGAPNSVSRRADGEGRNRSASQKFLKQKNVLFNSELNVNPYQQRLDRSKSTSNMQHLKHAQQFQNLYNDGHLATKASLGSQKAIKVSKQSVKSLRGKSLSTSKLKFTTGVPHYRYENSSGEKKGDSKERNGNLRSEVNLFRENITATLNGSNLNRNKKPAKSIIVDPRFNDPRLNGKQVNSNLLDVDSLLKKKLYIQGSPQVKVGNNKLF